MYMFHWFRDHDIFLGFGHTSHYSSQTTPLFSRNNQSHEFVGDASKGRAGHTSEPHRLRRPYLPLILPFTLLLRHTRTSPTLPISPSPLPLGTTTLLPLPPTPCFRSSTSSCTAIAPTALADATTPTATPTATL